jgi:hypothetical protein
MVYPTVETSIHYGHTKKSQNMKHEPILQMGSDRIPKLFMVYCPDKCEWQIRFNPDKNRAWAGTEMRPRPIEALVLVCTDGSQEGVTVFRTQIYAIKAYIMDSIEKGYTGRNICILSNSRNHQDL